MQLDQEFTEKAHAAYLRRIGSALAPVFADRPWMQSVGLAVAQYWNDEASDEVHLMLVPSQLPVPDFGNYLNARDADWNDDETGDEINLPDNVEFTDAEIPTYAFKPSHPYEDIGAVMGFNARASWIPLFAAFTEGGSQESDYIDNYVPHIVFKRDGDLFMVDPPRRPWLFGQASEWVSEYSEDINTVDEYTAEIQDHLRALGVEWTQDAMAPIPMLDAHGGAEPIDLPFDPSVAMNTIANLARKSADTFIEQSRRVSDLVDVLTVSGFTLGDRVDAGGSPATVCGWMPDGRPIIVFDSGLVREPISADHADLRKISDDE